MTRRNKAQRNLKTDARMTPYDVKVKGTFAEPPKKEKLPPRKPTSEEQRANNLAPVEFSRESASVGNWIPLFRKELAEMNSGKVGRPYSFVCPAYIPESFGILSNLFRYPGGESPLRAWQKEPQARVKGVRREAESEGRP